eukprot:3702653-Pyramimonas_sp.AAC.1
MTKPARPGRGSGVPCPPEAPPKSQHEAAAPSMAQTPRRPGAALPGGLEKSARPQAEEGGG